MLLNDTRNDRQRLAYLLAGSVERHTSAGQWTGAMVGVVFTAALFLLILWAFFRLGVG
jgi:hypothetical protein